MLKGGRREGERSWKRTDRESGPDPLPRTSVTVGMSEPLGGGSVSFIVLPVLRVGTTFLDRTILFTHYPKLREVRQRPQAMAEASPGFPHVSNQCARILLNIHT